MPSSGIFRQNINLLLFRFVRNNMNSKENLKWEVFFLSNSFNITDLLPQRPRKNYDLCYSHVITFLFKY